MIRPLIILLAAGTLACGGVAGNVRMQDPERMRSLQTAKTQAEVLELLGAPQARDHGLDGAEVWRYAYAESRTNGAALVPVVGLFAAKATMTLHTATVRFDIGGRVRDVRLDDEKTVYGPFGAVSGPR